MSKKLYKSRIAILLISCIMCNNCLTSLGGIEKRFIFVDEDRAYFSASPSEAPGTPSEATPSESSPSEAEGKFIAMSPTSEPSYYTNVGGYYTFYGREGQQYWRIHGSLNGVEGWYSCDNKGELNSLDVILLDEEYVTLAPYLYNSEEPKEKDWDTLSTMIYKDAEMIRTMERDILDPYMGLNFDGSYYDIWWLSKNLQDWKAEVSYYFYGHIENSKEKEDIQNRWYECNEQGEVLKGYYNNVNARASSTPVYPSGSIIGSVSGNVMTVRLPLAGFPQNMDSDFTGKLFVTFNTPAWFLYNIYCSWPSQIGTDHYVSVSGNGGQGLTFGSADSKQIAEGRGRYSTTNKNGVTTWHDPYITTSNGYEVLSKEANVGNGTYVATKEYGSKDTRGEYTGTWWNYDEIDWCDSYSVAIEGTEIVVRAVNPIPQVSNIATAFYYYGGEDENEGWATYMSGDISNYARQAHTHDGVTITNPTCTVNGSKAGKCTKCAQTLSESIPALGHVWPSEFVTTANNGTYYKNCTRCSDRIETKYNPYTIRFNANGGDGNMPALGMTYEAAKNLTVNTFTKQAYLFTGWNTAADGSGMSYTDGQNIINLTKVYNETVDLYAKWKLNECTITYDGNGGEVPISTKKVICKTNIGAEALPQATMTGNTFLGWSSEKDRPDKLLTADSQFETIKVTVYAQWRPNAYNVTFDPAEGTLTQTLKQVYYGAPIGDLPVPEIGGKTFTGWIRKTNTRALSVPISESTKLTQEGMDCRATYADVGYTLSYDANGGGFQGNVTSPSRAYGQPLGDFPDIVKEGYSLKGWFTEREGGNLMQSDSAMPAYDLNLFAHWYPNTYTIRYDFNGGTGTMTTQPMTYDVAKELKENKYIRNDFKFAGWGTNPEGTGSIYQDTEAVKNLTKKNGDEVILYAQWVRTSSLCTFYDWDNSLLGTAAFGVGDSIAYAEPKKTGSTFAGWQGLNGAPLENVTAPGSYKATYTVDFYIALFYDNETKKGEINADYNTVLGTLPIVEKEGYTFRGWFPKREGGIQITEDTLMPLNGATYYAQWDINKYTLQFDYMGGSESAKSISTEYGKAVGILPQSEKLGYMFANWNTLTDGKGQIIDSTYVMEAKNQTVYAIWDVANVLCTFLDEDGNNLQKLNVPYGQSANPNTPIKKGYLFLDWDKSLDEIKEATVFVASFAPITYDVCFVVNEEMYPGTSGNMEQITLTYDKIAKLLENNYVYNHFRFTGWTRNEDGSGNLIVDRANVINMTAVNQESVNLYAQFTRIESPCSFLNWDDTVLKDLIVPYREDAKAPEVPNRIGYTFTSWKPSITNVTEPMVFKAQYDSNTYMVRFNSNGGTGDMSEQAYTYDEPANLNINMFQKDYYVFDSWNIAKDGGGTSFSDGQKTENLTTMDGDVITLYAQWKLLMLESDYQTNIQPGLDKLLGTKDDIHFWNGSDGKPGTEDDVVIFPGSDGIYGTGDDYIVTHENAKKNEHTCPGADRTFGTVDDEIYTDGPDGKPGTDDDQQVNTSGDDVDYIDNGNGTHIRPGADVVFGTSDDELWTNGADGKPGTSDDKKINTSEDDLDYVDNGNGTHIRPGADGIFGTGDDELWTNGADGRPGTSDDTIVRNNGGGGSGGGGSKGSFGGEAASAAIGIFGTWSQNAVGKWSFWDRGGKQYVNEWVYIYNSYANNGKGDSDWFRFDEAGYMMTGWFKDGDGMWYYLNEKSDGTLGHMQVGWYWDDIKKKWYYLNQEPGGPSGPGGRYGHAVRGWLLINDKWYYFGGNEAIPYMFVNEITPDDYWISESGEMQK